LAGNGPERKYVELVAKNCPNIRVLGEISKEELQKLYSEAKAFLLPQKEDAGIVQLEALASGTPVIAYKAGGALDVIKEGENGIFFKEQTEESLAEAIKTFEEKTWNNEKIRASSLPYDTKKFQENFVKIIEEKLLK